MSAPPGTRFGPYEISAKLGEGGMGEVYRARDTKLDRDVAIKVLPPDVAGDAERIARFEREAKMLAALNHPNIAHVYAVEGTAPDGRTEVRPYIVMELVEGEDLAERLKRGPIPLEDALPIARQIAEGLEAAHEQGIIHRDLKPANVKVRADGTVKILDFGLAKALDEHPKASMPQSLTASPTITTPAMTMRGVILGTAAYMSPEQAKGKTVDRRADIWAFGCVLYEMLTGIRTFAGEDISDTLVSVLRDDPRWAALPPDTPPAIRRLLNRCLQKDPQKRLPHIGAARLELSEGAAVEPTIDAAATPPASLSSAIVFALIGAAIAAAGSFVMWPRTSDEPPLVVRFAIRPPAGESSFVGANMVPRFSVSPDGRTVVYQTQNGSASRLWMRTFEALEDVLVAGSESSVSGNNIQQVFWSPDSQHIAFFDQGAQRLKRMPRQGGGAHVIAEIESTQLGGTWNKDGVILMASLGTAGIRRVAASGGAVTQVTQLDAAAREGAHLWPEFFPDGRHFVYLVTYVDESPSALFVASIDGGPPKRLIEAPAGARPVWPDRLVYVRDGALVDQRFDLHRLELTGDATVIAANAPATGGGRLGVSASSDGRVLAYSSSARSTEGLETTWLDRSGRELAQSPPRVAVGTRVVRLSPDGMQLVYGRNVNFKGNFVIGELWTQDLVRGIEARIASNVLISGVPVFSPDGAIVATRPADSPSAIELQSVSGAAPAVHLTPAGDEKRLTLFDWSPDGSRLLYGEVIGQGNLLPDVMRVLPMAGDRVPSDYLSGVRVQGGTFSPDGKHVAVTEGNFGEGQVFIRPFPDATAGRWVVSAVGSRYPRWRRDGRELYFVNREGYVVAVPISLAPKVEIGTPVALFQVELVAQSAPFDVSPDGQRFVTVRNADSLTNPTSIIVTVNRGLAP